MLKVGRDFPALGLARIPLCDPGRRFEMTLLAGPAGMCNFILNFKMQELVCATRFVLFPLCHNHNVYEYMWILTNSLFSKRRRNFS